MANAHNSTSFSAQKPCMVAAARNRMNNAAENDDAGFDQATIDIETLPATSPAGVAAKFDALCLFLDAIEETGAAADYVSWETIAALRAGIRQGLLQLQHG